VNVVGGGKVYDKDVYLEVHDPDYLQEASSTITRPTGGHPPVTSDERRNAQAIRVGDGLHNVTSLPPARQWITGLPLPARHKLSDLTAQCSKCGALHFLEERLASSSRANPQFSKCCAGGKVQLANWKDPPARLWELFISLDPVCKAFRLNVRRYNNVLSMTSLGANEQTFHPQEGGVYSFRIKRALYHRHGPLVASQGKDPKFAQIYIHDPQDLDRQIANRLNVFRDNSLDPQVLRELNDILHAVNPYEKLYKTAGEVLSEEHEQPVALRLRILDGAMRDPRTYNTPTADEVGILIVGLGEEEYRPRDIVFYHRNPNAPYRGLQRINELAREYLPLRYVLICPYGESGWTTDIPFRNNRVAGPADRDQYGIQRDQAAVATDREENPDTGRGGCKHVTAAMWHSYYLHDRPGVKSILLRAGRLFQEWVVDAAAVNEQNKLKSISENQLKSRAETYSSFKGVVAESDEVNPSDLGVKVILPSSFGGSPRHMAALYQDAMAVVRYFGKPDLFITMTCNPNWPEITDNLFPGQTASDRPDLVSRVFELKLQELMSDIRKRGIFGTVQAFIYVIEFQKRGLPHAHMLFILEEQSSLKTSEHVDSTVKAEFPDPEKDPELWETVTTCMLHGPCTKEYPEAHCLKDGRGIAGCCSKYYPKDFREQTSMGSQGYPEYRRRKEGPQAFTFKKKLRRGDGQYVEFEYTNEWVVPYNPFLSKKFNCHINVEICSSIKDIKYLYKYVYKGPDRANVGLNRDDPERLTEPKLYLDARYLSPPESCARILGFKMHDGDSPVVRLALHLEDQQRVFFEADPIGNAQDLLPGIESRRTTLTAWFLANSMYEEASELLYVDFPTK
jgi:hypothetical protein